MKQHTPSLRVCLLTALSSALLACQSPFLLKAKPTKYFPYSWEEARAYQLANRPLPSPGEAPLNPTAPTQQAPLSQPSAPMSASVAAHEGEESEVERVAVLELKNRLPQEITRDEISFLTNEARAVVSALPKSHFIVMTRESLQMLIAPGKRLEDCVGTCEVETGRMIGAQWIITGEVVRFGTSLRVSLKLHDTRTGQLISGGSLKGKTVEDLEQPIKEETLRLAREISPYFAQRLREVGGDDLSTQLKALKRGALR